jgi:hypothetical protein
LLISSYLRNLLLGLQNLIISQKKMFLYETEVISAIDYEIVSFPIVTKHYNMTCTRNCRFHLNVAEDSPDYNVHHG